MSSEIREITETEIVVRTEHSWAYLRFQETTGSVTILSDYGYWSFFWPPRQRSDNLPAFLARLNCGYAGRKFLGNRLWVYDGEKTQEKIRGAILEERRDGFIDQETARLEWDLFESHDKLFEAWWQATSLDDASELRGEVMEPEWTNFWECLWEPFIQPALLDLAGRPA